MTKAQRGTKGAIWIRFLVTAWTQWVQGVVRKLLWVLQLQAHHCAVPLLAAAEPAAGETKKQVPSWAHTW